MIKQNFIILGLLITVIPNIFANELPQNPRTEHAYKLLIEKYSNYDFILPLKQRGLVSNVYPKYGPYMEYNKTLVIK